MFGFSLPLPHRAKANGKKVAPLVIKKKIKETISVSISAGKILPLTPQVQKGCRFDFRQPF